MCVYIYMYVCMCVSHGHTCNTICTYTYMQRLNADVHEYMVYVYVCVYKKDLRNVLTLMISSSLFFSFRKTLFERFFSPANVESIFCNTLKKVPFNQLN